MSDSFFTTRTSADLQFDGIHSIVCEAYLDACVRRIAQLDGPLEAAKKVQRLADICSGAYVLPIEHWHKVESPKPAAPPPASRRKRFFDFIGSPAVAWLSGLATGYFMGSS
jgi:hypothetical protein